MTLFQKYDFGALQKFLLSADQRLKITEIDIMIGEFPAEKENSKSSIPSNAIRIHETNFNEASLFYG